MYIQRHLENIIKETTAVFPIVLVTGPRQVGKTTMLKKISEKNRTYVTLDNPLIRELAVKAPSLFLQRYTPPLLIDEIQYAPDLLPYIKMYVDENKKKGDFWLTGSQMFHQMKNVSESLAGRVAVIQMSGLSASEIKNETSQIYTTGYGSLSAKLKSKKKESLQDVYKRIWKGSMPALYENEQNIEIYYSSYVNTYLQRDIKDLTQIADELTFMRFMTSCAARTSQMVNYTDLAKDIGISSPTAKQWLSILVSSGVIVLIEPYFNNALKRIIKAPNMYFMDTGLCAYLTRWTNPDALEVSTMARPFFETYIVSEIVKSYYNSGICPALFYYRDSDNKEIDLLIENNNILYPIEIKKSGTPKKEFIKHFAVLEKTGKEIGTGNVICFIDDLLPVDNNNYYVPAWLV
ncbi:MAG: ATPase [Spirochaetes bacterium GWF1_31_7]|nr:MAG: ATPase [Spirochaetes bacterium GWE1_32_154]OHD47240.1 MAG: ATPase [Spirochaetes bacterium GWF1_31_7]OHD52806.1 MAG: ATPase [Spirochaetes bacterium GWE2_31_10]OHD80554.1 MAG: ATPase [Spirochaetes bacterium RIFOXYB1_FULL_32_8]HBD94282.1 ATPase [Spirochaetia bacterium]